MWWRRLASVALCVAAVLPVAACGSNSGIGVEHSPSAGTPTAQGLYVPPTGAYLGVSSDWDRVAAFEQTAGITQPAIWNNYTEADGSFAWILDNVKQRPTITPMVSWNLPMTGDQVTNGSQDSYIKQQADLVVRFGKPIFVRLDWEMNQAINPGWSLPAVTPQEFVASWQRVVNIFRDAGAAKAAFVWAPNVFPGSTGTEASAWYPGDGFVNWMGLDAYPQYADSQAMLNGPDGMNSQAAFAQAHGKPLMLAEWAVTTSPVPGAASDSDAVNLVFNWAEAWPKTVKALVYFDFVTQGQDFTLASHPEAAATYRQRSSNRSVYLTSLVP
jgi:hypothetical protein